MGRGCFETPCTSSYSPKKIQCKQNPKKEVTKTTTPDKKKAKMKFPNQFQYPGNMALSLSKIPSQKKIQLKIQICSPSEIYRIYPRCDSVDFSILCLQNPYKMHSIFSLTQKYYKNYQCDVLLPKLVAPEIFLKKVH